MLYRVGRVILVLKVIPVHMALLDILEGMVPLESQDLKDHLATKAEMQLIKIAINVHPLVPLRVTKVVLVNQEMLGYLANLANQVLLVNLVDAFLVNLDHLEEMVNQVMMEWMAGQVNLAILEALEKTLALRRVTVQISSLT